MVSCNEEALRKAYGLLIRHTHYKVTCCLLNNELWDTAPVNGIVRTSWSMFTYTSVALPPVYILTRYKSWPLVTMARSEITVAVGQPLNRISCLFYAPF